MKVSQKHRDPSPSPRPTSGASPAIRASKPTTASISMRPVFALRRLNLEEVLFARFGGKRTALARATDIHENQINLIFSTSEYKRNLGEVLARKIERALGLEAGWLDEVHKGAGVSGAALIEAGPIDDGLARVLRRCQRIQSLTLDPSQCPDVFRKVQSHKNLVIATIDTDDLAPELKIGDDVIVETSIGAPSADGTFVVELPSGVPMIRSVGRDVLGSLTIARSNQEPMKLTIAIEAKITWLARIVSKIAFPLAG